MALSAQKVRIPRLQMTLLMVHFMTSGIQVINIFTDKNIPIWTIMLFAVVFSVPLLLIFARLATLYPDLDLFGMFEAAFGKTVGKVFTAVYTLYAIYLASVNLRYMGEYVQVVSLPDTPLFIFLFAISVFCWWILRHGAEVFARFSAVVYPIMTAVWIVILLMSLHLFDFSYHMPAFAHDIPDMVSSGADLAAFSFSETFLFLCLLCNVEKKHSGAFGVYFSSFALSSVFIFLLMSSDMLILGRPAMAGLYFPHFSAMSIINIGDFVTNIEVVGILQYVISSSIKVCVCIYAATRGLASVFKTNNAKMLTAPVVLLVSVAAPTAFRSTLEMIRFNFCYKYIAALFHVAIPVVVYASAEIKHIINKKKGVIQNDIQRDSAL